MKILDRYVLKGFFTVFLLSLFVLATMFMVISVVDSLDWMMAKRNVPINLIVKYYASLLPYAMYMMAPLNVLFAVLITLGMMSQRNEITVMKAGGVSLIRLALPILISSCFIGLFTYWFGDAVVPQANRRVEELKRVIYHKKVKSDYQRKVWYVSERPGSPPWIYRVMNFVPEQNTLQGFVVYKMNRDFMTEEIIQAETAKYNGSGWTLSKVRIDDFPKDGPLEVHQYDTYDLSIPEKVQDFMFLQLDPEEMDLKQLKDQAMKVDKYGFDPAEYQVEIEARRSLPVASIIMVLLAVPFAIRGVRDQGLARGIFYAVILGFIYYVVLAEAVSLGKNGTFPPLFAAWVSNGIFGIVGIVMFTGTRT